MNKQRITIGLGIASLLLGTLIASPLRVNAGQVVVPGSTPDSSGTSGDTFAPNTVTTTLISKVNGITVSPDSRPGAILLIVTQTVQIALNNFANTLFSQTNVTTIRAEVRELFTRRGRNVITVTQRIKSNWIGYGVRETRIDSLLIKLSQIVTVITSSESGVPVGQLSPEQLSASIKQVKANSTLAQSSDPAVVDVIKLSEAIDEYNQLVKESDVSTLQQLSQDETFMEISKILKEFRATLTTVN